MLFNKKKKNGYQTRKQLQRSEKIKIIVVSVFFVLMCAATGVTCALVAISAKESSETEGFSSDTSFLTIDDVEPIEWGVKSEGSEEVESNKIVTKLDDEVIDSSTLPENYSLSYELSGTLPVGLYFNENTGEIYGTPTQITTSNEPFHITAYFFHKINNSNCIIGKSNDFTISIYGLMINNTISNIVYYMEDENDLSTDEPRMTFKGEAIPNSAITWSLDNSNDPYPGLNFSQGRFVGKPIAASGVPILYRLKAEYRGYTAFSNQFKLTVIYNPKNVFTVSGVTNLEKHCLDGHAGTTIDEDNTWMNPVVTKDDNLFHNDYNTTYQLNKKLPDGLFIDESTGKIYGQFPSVPFPLTNYILTVTIFTELNSFEFLIFFSIKIDEIKLELSYTGNCTSQINGEPFDISFKAKFNGKTLANNEYTLEYDGTIPVGMVFNEEDKKLQGMPNVDILSMQNIEYDSIGFKAFYNYHGEYICTNEEDNEVKLTLKYSFTLDYEDSINNWACYCADAYMPLVKTSIGEATLFLLDPEDFDYSSYLLWFEPLLFLNNTDVTAGFYDNSGIEYEPEFNAQLLGSDDVEKTKTKDEYEIEKNEIQYSDDAWEVKQGKLSELEKPNCYLNTWGPDTTNFLYFYRNSQGGLEDPPVVPEEGDKIVSTATFTWDDDKQITTVSTITIKLIHKLDYQLKSDISGSTSFVLNDSLAKEGVEIPEELEGFLTEVNSNENKDIFKLGGSALETGITFDLSIMRDETELKYNNLKRNQRIRISKINSNSHFILIPSILKLIFSPYERQGDGEDTKLNIYYEEFDGVRWIPVSTALINIVW